MNALVPIGDCQQLIPCGVLRSDTAMARIVHIPNPLMPAVGLSVFEAEPGATVSEAIERAGWRLRYSTVLSRNGVLIKRADWDAVPLGAGEIAFLVTLPQDGGGGVSGVIKTIATIALAVAAAVYGGPIAGFIVGSGASATVLAATTVAVQAAIVIGGSYLVSAVMPKPAGYKPPSVAQASPTYSLGLQSNQARLGQPIPEGFGTNRMFPDLAAQPYTDYADDKQRIYELFCLGMGSYNITEIRVADTAIWQNGVYTGAYPEIAVEIVPPGGSVTLFPDNVVTSTEVASIVLLGTNEVGYAWSGPFVANAAATETTQIGIDITLPGGLFTFDSNGNLVNASVSFSVEAQEIDDVGNPLGDWTEVIAQTLTLATRDTIRRSYYAAVAAGRYQVRVERTNAKPGGNTQDDLVWIGLRAFLPSQSVYDGVTVIAVKAQASDHLNGQSAQQFNVICTRELPIYNTGTKAWSALTATRTISAAAAQLCRDGNGAGIADTGLDLDLLFGSLETTWTARGDFFDGVFDTRRSFWEALTAILQVGRTIPLQAGAAITWVRDEPKTAYRAAFSPRNMITGSFSVDYQLYDENAADAVIVEFIDSRSWSSNEILCKLPDSTVADDDPTIPRIDFFGITDRNHAWREGIYMAAASRYRRRFPNFRTEFDGRVCFRGDLIKVSHWLPSWGSSAEAMALTEDAGGDILTLSEPWSVPAGHAGDQKLVLLMTPDGKPYGPVTFALIDDGATTRQAQIRLTQTADPGGKYAGQIPRDWPVWSGSGLQFERPMAMLGVGSLVAQDAIVVAMKPESGQTASLVAVIEDARVHTAEDGAIPPETNPPEGVPFTSLTITGLQITRTLQADGSELMNVVVVGAPDATSFSAEWKWDAAASYGDEVKGLPRSFALPAEGSELTIQVRAWNRSSVGDWFVATSDASSAPPAVADLTVRQVGGNITISFTPLTGNLITGYDYLYGPDGGDISTATYLDRNRAAADLTTAAPAPGTYKFYVVARDIYDRDEAPARGTAASVTFTILDEGTLTLAELVASGITAVEIFNTLPTTGNFEGRQVYLTTDGQLYRYHSGAWTVFVPAANITGQIVAAQIADASITTAKFAAGINVPEILGALPVSGNFDGRLVYLTTDKKLYRYDGTAGAFTASVAAADISGQVGDAQISGLQTAKLLGSIVASQIQVPSLGAALNSDPQPSDINAWPTQAGITGTLQTNVADGKVGTSTLRSNAGQMWSATDKAVIPVDPNKTYRAHALYRSDPTADGFFYLRVDLRDNTGARISGDGTMWYHAVGGAHPGAVWTEGIGAFGNGTAKPFPANACTMQINVLLNNTGTVGYFEAQDIRIEEMLPGTLIKDGAIITSKLAAGAVTANEIAAATITGAKIAASTITASNLAADTITAGQIAAGAIGTTELAANAVTAAKIAAGTITANEIAADTITGAKIAAGAISSSELAANAVVAGKVAAGAINAGAIIVNDLIVTGHLVAGAVTTGISIVTAGPINANTTLAAQGTFTGSGNVVIVDIVFHWAESDSGQSWNYAVIRDTTTVFQSAHFGGAFAGDVREVMFVDGGAAGSHTWKLDVTPESGETFTLTNITFVVKDWQR